MPIITGLSNTDRFAEDVTSPDIVAAIARAAEREWIAVRDSLGRHHAETIAARTRYSAAVDAYEEIRYDAAGFLRGTLKP